MGGYSEETAKLLNTRISFPNGVAINNGQMGSSAAGAVFKTDSKIVIPGTTHIDCNGQPTGTPAVPNCGSKATRHLRAI
ncbi:MAG: hypothetical protein HOQ05_08965 [Corynebacteriales bacterium]|nr:hypothetical protein [Mycobacteriales bacterium]